MISFTSSPAHVIQQGTCRGTLRAVVEREAVVARVSVCRSTLDQSTVRPSIAVGGVPVLKRDTVSPIQAMTCGKLNGRLIARRPAGICVSSPMWMRPRRKVPAVMITARARNLRPSAVSTPPTRAPLDCRGADFVTNALGQLECREALEQVAGRAPVQGSGRTAPGAQTAGPLERLSMRNWMVARSAARP